MSVLLNCKVALLYSAHYISSMGTSLRWYGDNSELNGIWSADIPDIVLFGGIALDDENAKKLVGVMNAVKASFGTTPRHPLKWNFKDLRKWFQTQGELALFEQLQGRGRDFRKAIFEAAQEVDFRIVVSCVKHHSIKREIIKDTRATVARYAFCNALMRVALHAKDTAAMPVEIILDWPDGGNYSTFTEEYRNALWHGNSGDGSGVVYHSGPLKNIGFRESLLFTRMEDSSLLQFSDLVVGATREFVDFALGRRDADSFGVQMTKMLIPKFRGSPSRIVGYGISVAPTDGELSRFLREGMIKLKAAPGRTSLDITAPQEQPTSAGL